MFYAKINRRIWKKKNEKKKQYFPLEFHFIIFFHILFFIRSFFFKNVSSHENTFKIKKKFSLFIIHWVHWLVDEETCCVIASIGLAIHELMTTLYPLLSSNAHRNAISNFVNLFMNVFTLNMRYHISATIKSLAGTSCVFYGRNENYYAHYFGLTHLYFIRLFHAVRIFFGRFIFVFYSFIIIFFILKKCDYEVVKRKDKDFDL